MIDLSKDRPWIFFLFLFSFFIFTRSLSLHGVEYRDDEIFYFRSTSEMLEQGNFLSPTYFGENRFQKPILFYWFVILSYKIFGVNWFAARLTAACFAALSVAYTFLLARRFFSKEVALLSGFIILSLPLFLRHAKNVVPDMALNFFIIAAVYYGVSYFYDRRKSLVYQFYVFSALGFMVKGIAALVVPLGSLVIFLWATKKGSFKDLNLGRGLLIWSGIILPWFLFMIALHGPSYLEYMVVEETKNRIVGDEGTNLFLRQGQRFVSHALFYLRTILAYFLPWSILGLVGLPTVIVMKKKMAPGAEREGVMLCLGWIILVFLIFSNMYFKISHYMLVMTAPFAIFTSYFMLAFFKEPSIQKKAAAVMGFFLLVALGIGFFTFGFLFVFLAGEPRWWFAVFAILYLVGAAFSIKKGMPAGPAISVSLFIVFVFSQSALMAQAGVSSHGTLQRFAQTIHAQAREPYVVGVGSHDIHEKEFQVYFDRPLIKAGHSHQGRMELQLRELVHRSEEVYCLLTQKDYNEYSNLFDGQRTEILERESLVRKRMKLDRGFLRAFLSMDGKKVREYLVEEVLLVRKK